MRAECKKDFVREIFIYDWIDLKSFRDIFLRDERSNDSTLFFQKMTH